MKKDIKNSLKTLKKISSSKKMMRLLGFAVNVDTFILVKEHRGYALFVYIQKHTLNNKKLTSKRGYLVPFLLG